MIIYLLFAITWEFYFKIFYSLPKGGGAGTGLTSAQG